MKTDYIDVLQFHASPSKQTLEEDDALDAVQALKRAGKVRFVGMSGTLPHLVDHIAMGVFDVFQIPYSAVEREHEALIAAAAESGAGIVIRGGAAKGAPSGGGQAAMQQWERWQKARHDPETPCCKGRSRRTCMPRPSVASLPRAPRRRPPSGERVFP